MSAETLRQAAALMRERAEANCITPSPWSFAGVSGQGFAVHRGEHDTVALYANLPDAKHIAAWDPRTALAVADLLDEIALRWEYVEERELALAVARAYFGETS